MDSKNLERWRRKLGWTQADAARALLTPIGTYKGWEMGRRTPPCCLPLACERAEELAREAAQEGARV